MKKKVHRCILFLNIIHGTVAFVMITCDPSWHYICNCAVSKKGSFLNYVDKILPLPTTYPWLTLVKEFLYCYYKAKCVYCWHFKYLSTSYLPRLLNVVRTTPNFGGACFSGLQISLLDTAHFSSFKNKCLNCNISSFQFSSDPLKPHPLLSFYCLPKEIRFSQPFKHRQTATSFSLL